jgi:hypothetical protein
LDDGSFNNDMIDLLVIVSSLPLVVEIGVGDPGYCKDCAVGGKGVGLSWRFTDL